MADPKLRPTFAEIIAALKPLQKSTINSQVARVGATVASGHEKGQLQDT